MPAYLQANSQLPISVLPQCGIYEILCLLFTFLLTQDLKRIAASPIPRFSSIPSALAVNFPRTKYNFQFLLILGNGVYPPYPAPNTILVLSSGKKSKRI